jgi:TRAP-type C4-dicarboxylate transport system substrate-binding protein
MKGGQNMKWKAWFVPVCLLIVAAVVLSACAPAAGPTPTPAPKPTPKPVVIKAVSFIAKDHLVSAYAKVFVERVNKQAKGRLRIDYLGGPEVIPPFEQVEALRKGAVVQMTFSPTAYYASLLPEADVMHLTELTPMEERKPGGLYDFMVERHKKIGLFYLGRWTYNMPFYLYTNKKVDRPQQLAGQKMRTAALYDPFMKALGIVPVTLPYGEVYTALERGVVDGFGWPGVAVVALGWNKVCKYIIEPGFYEQNGVILMNLDTWNSLPKDLQDLLKDVAIKLEPDMADHFAKVTKEERQKMLDGGMQVIKFSPADAKWYRDLAYKVQWDEIEKKVKDPALVAKLKELVKKK